MRTLALLTALLLVALQAQAGTLQDRAEDEEAPAQELPGAEAQDVAISFAGDQSSGVRAAGLQGRATCYCRSSCCNYGELYAGHCTQNGVRYRLCCS
ncbi:defensin-5 preproprotein [Daubentonia madagascariensis]|uniref:Defensin-5 preproprotein n=1 Tax=Daubentonia madagascariensis TaxID=31869 RepID=A0ABD2D472_DAUMA